MLFRNPDGYFVHNVSFVRSQQASPAPTLANTLLLRGAPLGPCGYLSRHPADLHSTLLGLAALSAFRTPPGQ